MPISFTSPLQPSIMTISPTWNSPSKTMKIPARISATKDWEPRPIIRVKTPAVVNNATVFAPQASIVKNKAVKAIAHLKNETNNLAMVLLFLPRKAILAK